MRPSLRGFVLAVIGAAALLGGAASSDASGFRPVRSDSLAAIAWRNEIPLWALEQANPHIRRGRLLPGDRVMLPKHLIYYVFASLDEKKALHLPDFCRRAPARSVAAAQAVRDVPRTETHATGSSGDGSGPLQDLSDRFGR